MRASSRPSAAELLRDRFLEQVREGGLTAAQQLERSLKPRLEAAILSPVPRAAMKSPSQSLSGSYRHRRSPSSASSSLNSRPKIGLSPLDMVGIPASVPVDISVGAARESSHRSPEAPEAAARLDSPSPQVRMWLSGGPSDEIDEAEMKRRAREWVNKTVPMQMADEVGDSPEREARPFDVWDSDDEGVSTRAVRDSPAKEAAVPAYMKMLGRGGR